MSPILGIFASQGRVAGNSYESIATVTVGAGGSSNISFSSIPSTYKHLQIRGLVKSTQSATGNTYDNLTMQLNGDTGSNYTRHALIGNGASASVYGIASTTFAQAGFVVRSDSAAANMFSVTIIDILDYSSTSKYKTTRGLVGNDLDTTNQNAVALVSSVWQNTAAVTSIVLGNDNSYAFAQYTQVGLYGIKG